MAINTSAGAVPGLKVDQLPLLTVITLLILGAATLSQLISTTQALLFLTGAMLGAALYYASFGFTGGWKRFATEGRSRSMRAQFVMIGITAIVFIPLMSAQMTIMYKPVKNEAANQFVRQARSREQANLVPTDESGVRQIFKALKQGGTTVILPDHTPHQGGEFVPYFGVPLASSNLSAKLIQKTKAKALLLYAMRNDHGLFDMHIEALDDAIYQGTANDGTYVIHQAIEQLIQRYPEHYHWSYKRFKANPALRGLYNVPEEEALSRIQQLRQTAAQDTSV